MSVECPRPPSAVGPVMWVRVWVKVLAFLRNPEKTRDSN
jgi:hypothetical protein